MRRIVELPRGKKIAVAGASHYQDSIADVLRTVRAAAGGRLNVWGELVPEPLNVEDPNAVAVLVAGRKIGYLPRAKALEYGEVRSRILDSKIEARVVVALRGNDLTRSNQFVAPFIEVADPVDCLAALS